MMIRIRIHTSDYWIRIREAQKHVDPVDPDPQHCFKVTKVVFLNENILK
jgi:hypothetical protein